MWDKFEPKFRREAAAATDAKLPGEVPPCLLGLDAVNNTISPSF
jgi:hypothetical protein